MKKSFFVTAALLLGIILLIPVVTKAQNGSLDITFGTGGKVVTDLGGDDLIWSVNVQSDGKILAAGRFYSVANPISADFALVRYNTNGSLDNTFGNGGIVITDIDSSEMGKAVLVQLDGKIVVVGDIINQDFVLVRYNTDGSFDNSFGVGGKVISDITGTNGFATSAVLQSDGKILVTGSIRPNGIYGDIVLIRYKTNGSLDSTFDGDGIQTKDIGDYDLAHSVKVQQDGKIVVGGAATTGAYNDFAVLRYNVNGSLDNTFGIGGMQTTAVGNSEDVPYAVDIQSDGKIVAAGYTRTTPSKNDCAVVRYNTNGTLDNTFGNAGITITNVDSSCNPYAMRILSDGKILVAGWKKISNTREFILICYKTDGTPDSTFGNAGIVTTNILGNDYAYSLTIQNDEKIVVAGYGNTNFANNDFVLARYNYNVIIPDGLNSIANQIYQIKNYPNPFSTQTTIQLKTEILNAQLLLYDLLGNQVKQLNHLYGTEIKLNRDNLPAGMYTIQLKQESKTIARDKVIIVD